MTLLDALNAFITSLSTVNASSRVRYRYHALEAVRFYGGNPHWALVREDQAVACIPLDYTSTRSIVKRTIAWMGV